MATLEKFIGKKENLLIIFVFVIALLFRFYKLAEHPVSLSMDEVSIGYNAYSILKTGKDEWGQSFPLAFRSVGDYKPPVNIYLTVPFVALLGLTETAVRTPVALLGSLSVVAFIYLLKELGIARIGYLFGGLWFAVVPWHVHFSRGSFEAVTALFFILSGTLFFLASVRKKSLLLFGLSLSLFALSMWSYHAERLFVPFLLIFLIFLEMKHLGFLTKNRGKFYLTLLPFLILIIPFVHLTLFTKSVKERVISTSIFREQSLISKLHYGEYANFGERIFNNDSYLIVRHASGKYLNYFDLRYWFWKGMQYTPPQFLDMGLFYAVDIFLILPGIYFLLTNKNKNLNALSVFWFFAGPIPAAFTMNEQHPLRSLIWLPFFGMGVAVGFEKFYKPLKENKVLVGIYGVLLFANIIYFADMYFRQFPRFYSEAWGYGYKEIAQYVCQNKDKYESIFVTDTYGSVAPINTGIPAGYILFYCNVDPQKHITSNYAFEKIKIKRMVWGKDNFPDNSLIVGSYWDLPPDSIESSMIVKMINYPSGKSAFVFVDTTEHREKKY